MAIGGILIGAFIGVIAGVASLCLGASMMSAFRLYLVIGGAATLAVIISVFLRYENEESRAVMV